MMSTKVAEKPKKLSVRELRRQASALLKQLSPERLKTAVEFMGFLREKEGWEATWDILTDPKMMEMIRKAEERRRAKDKKAFVPWEEVKKALK